MHVYTLQPGASLFHGTYANVAPADIQARANFFGDLHTAKAYCRDCRETAPRESPNVYEFAVTKPLVLLAMDDCVTVKALYESKLFTGTEIRRAFDCALGREMPLRYSTRVVDAPIFNRICSVLGVSGYAAKDLPMAKGYTFPAEAYLCADATAKGIKYVGQRRWW
jgi:hypothetical protein